MKGSEGVEESFKTGTTFDGEPVELLKGVTYFGRKLCKQKEAAVLFCTRDS